MLFQGGNTSLHCREHPLCNEHRLKWPWVCLGAGSCRDSSAGSGRVSTRTRIRARGARSGGGMAGNETSWRVGGPQLVEITKRMKR